MAESTTSRAPERHPVNRILAVVGNPVVVSVLLAFVLGATIIAVSGSSPSEAFREMFNGAFTGSGLRNTLARAIPIAGMAFVFAIPYRAGVINLGGQGQMVTGALAGALVAINMPGPSWLVMLAAVVAGTAVGAAWAFLPAIGQTAWLMPILITSLLLNYIASSLTGYMVRFHFLDPIATGVQTVAVPLDRRLPLLPIAGGVTISILVMLAVMVVIALYNKRTVGGYESLVTGINPKFAWYGGVGVDRQRTRLMVAAGALAGAVGTHTIIGQLFVYIDGDLEGTAFAWSGIMVALLAPRNAYGIVIASLLFAALQVGGLGMQRATDVPWQLAQVLQGVVIIAFISRFAIKWRLSGSKENPPDSEEPAQEVNAVA